LLGIEVMGSHWMFLHGAKKYRHAHAAIQTTIKATMILFIN